MSHLYWRIEDQVRWLRPYFPKSRGQAGADDRRVLSRIIFINRNGLAMGCQGNGLRWCDAPADYGFAKPLYNRWKRWRDLGHYAHLVSTFLVETLRLPVGIASAQNQRPMSIIS